MSIKQPDYFFEFPELPPGLNGDNGLLRKHWSFREDAVALWRLRIQSELQVASAQLPFKSCLVVYTIAAVNYWDWDNMAASFKVVGDALVKAGVLLDDKPSVVKHVHFNPVKVEHRHDKYVRVEIYELPDSVKVYEINQKVLQWVLSNYALAGT